MKHRVTLKSTFDNKGYLETFTVIGITPPFDRDIRREATSWKRVGIYREYCTYIMKSCAENTIALWLRPYYDNPKRYSVDSLITREEYQQSLKVWNKTYEDIEVVDINNKIIGEL